MLKIYQDMSDEEADYMSDAWLEKCASNDVRPGLKNSFATRRLHEQGKKRAIIENEQKNLKYQRGQRDQIEEANRDEGLKTSLDASNKGFTLLQKMGYKSGEGLGKWSTGVVEPVPIEIPTNRLGFGRQAALQSLRKEKHKLLKEQKSQMSKQTQESEFRALLSQRHHSKRIERDLLKSQRACYHCDLANKVSEPAESWFWPFFPSSESEQPEVTCLEFDEAQQLALLTAYLRQAYAYCIWCGHAFENLEELQTECPGDTKKAHDDIDL